MTELEMSGWCHLDLHYDCEGYDADSEDCECPCHEGDE